ncbi:MAG: type II secretion system protein M [Desulfofustis sp.]|nr:type II secretion system protein M [Desulfofustis sp.]
MTGLFRTHLSRFRLRSGFHNLDKREKWFLMIGIVFVAGFILIQGIIVPYLSARSALESSLARKKQEALDMAILQQDFRELKVRQGGITRQIAQRSTGFSLFSYLETKATEAGIKERVASMKPSTKEFDDGFRESAVEMKIEQVTLERLVDFMTRTESVENVVVTKRIAIQQNSQQADLLDVIVTIATFEGKGVDSENQPDPALPPSL